MCNLATSPVKPLLILQVIFFTALFIPTFVIVVRQKSWQEHHFDTWGHYAFTSNIKDAEQWGRRGQMDRSLAMNRRQGVTSEGETTAVP
jgi:hypothetical protein